MKKLFNSVWFNLLFIVSLTVLALVYALYDSYETVWNNIKHIDPYKLVLILALGSLPYLCWGAVITVLGKTMNKKFRYRSGVMTAYIGGFMQGITPSSTGGQFAQVYALKHRGLKPSQGAGVISIDFFVYQIAIVLVAVTMYIVFLSTVNNTAISFVFGVGLMVNSFVVFLLWLMVTFPKLYHKISFWGIHLLHKMKFIKNKEKILDEWNKTLTNFSEAIESVTQNKIIFLKVIGLHVMNLLCYYSTPFWISAILGIPLTFQDFFPMMGMASFVSVSNAFVPTPGSSGVTESLFVLAFSTIIGKGHAASTMILWRFTNFYIPVLTGGFLFMRVKKLNPFKPIKTSDLMGDSDPQ